MIPVLVAFGSNMGDRVACLTDALRELSSTPGWVMRRTSRVYETRPVGGPPQDPYLNAVVLFDAESEPERVLERLHAVEDMAGRERPGRNHPRTLDLDLLLFGDRVIGDQNLQVPHPRMTERAFVMAPAAEIAADMIHPVSGLTLAECAERLQPMEGVQLHGPDGAWA